MDFDGSQQNAIQVTGFGMGATQPYLRWTGTNANGTTASRRYCSDW